MRCDYYDCGCSLDNCDDDEIHIVEIDGKTYHLCDTCYEDNKDDDFCVCPDCGNVVASAEMMQVGSYDCVCRECYDDHYYTCARCGEVVHSDDIYYCEDCEEDFCYDCYEEHQSEQHRAGDIGGYHSHDYDCPRLGKGDMPYLGVELEMGDACSEDMRRCSGEIENDFGRFFVMEEDGSIRDYGFETISNPYTWDWWLAHKNMVENLYDTFSNHDMKPHYSCGFHVHITKAALPALTWRALQWFISKNQSLFEELAGREENDWVEYGDPDDDYREGFWERQDDTHYAALSFCTSTHVTCEFRIFCPVDCADDFFGHLAIVQGLYEWAKDTMPLGNLHMVEMPRRAVYDWFNWNKKRMEETNGDKNANYLYRRVNEQLEEAMKRCRYA